MSIAEAAQVEYTVQQIRLDDLAREQHDLGYVLSARKLRHKAAIAYRAAKAEKVNPDPDEIAACRICGGVNRCVPAYSTPSDHS